MTDAPRLTPAEQKNHQAGLAHGSSALAHGSSGLAVLLAALSMVGPFTIDTFFPSFHAIAAQFSLSPWMVQQTVTAYLIPLSFMSLVQGPLSDAIGRRPVILAGLAIYTVAAIGCTWAPTFGTLL